AGKFYTNYSTVNTSRWQVFSDLVNIHDVSHTTASWGGSRTFFYNATSAESDDIVFDHDLAWTQSQSNAGNQDSRPQAWAKNVFSIGGVNHANDSNPNNDSWQNGGASIGPASDGRIKPTLCAYYDNIGTSDRTGSAGYSSGNWTSSFGGTSGATPIVAGHNVLAIEMYTTELTPGVGLFGQPLRVPNGTAHQNRPHFPTLKALQVANASQYSFTGASSDNRREHQGWGFPDLQSMFDNRTKTYIVDETAVLNQGQVHQHDVTVQPGEPALKVCLNWNEPAANPASALHLINNLSLRVTAPNGATYWGNHNLENGVWSTTGGSEDTINSLECVFVQNPQAGVWSVEVIGSAIVQDNHVETGAVDADYGLVVVGGTGQGGGGGGTFATVAPVGSGCGGTQVICDGAFYEYPSFDLQNSSWTLVFDGVKYTLVPGLGSWIAPNNALGFGDDTTAQQTLPFTLGYPGGSTNQLQVCSNGWVVDGSYTGGNNYSAS
ncbi:MAG: S8 family serine peptidase, partial [Planctomycetes bacterium]|nr:S8 family serine peptidase [Planctomycetota bacterium]